MSDKRITLQVRIKEELKNKAIATAEKKGINLLSYIRMILIEAIERDSK